MDKRLRERRAIQQELRTAVARGELILHYQPQAKIGGKIVGFEALVRWKHPTRGMISAGTFVPIAEESGLILPIGEWVLREACREAASWPQPLQIAVNLSPAQFHHGDLPGPDAFDPARNRAERRPARAGDHRGRSDRRFFAGDLDPAPAQGARRAHRDGRFRDRLFVAVLPARLPLRQDQDRSRLHRRTWTAIRNPPPSSAP